MPNIDFVHLHCHSEYSVKNSLIRIPKLIDKTKDLGMKAIALTDVGNLFAAVKFYQKSISNGLNLFLVQS